MGVRARADSSLAAADLRPAVAATGISLVAVGCVLALATAGPRATLVGLAALAIVLVCLIRIELAVLLVAGTAPLEAAFASGPAGISVTKLAGGLVFASFAVYALRSGRPLRFEAGQGVVLCLLAIVLVSMLQARDTSAAMTTASRYASFVALYIVITQLTYDHALMRRLAWALSLTSTAAAVVALRRYFAGQDVVATLPYANPSDFAFILATTLPLTFWLLGQRARFRALVVGMIGTISAAIVLSLSRGTLVGLAAGIAFLLLVDRRRLRIVLAGGAIALAGAAFVIHSDPAKFQNALQLKQQVAQYNVTTRFEAWNAAGDLAAAHPLLGVGPGNFQDYYNEATGTPPGTHNLLVAHDAYLDIGAELGFVAMVLFLGYLGLAFWRLTAAQRHGLGPPGLAQALRVSLVIACVCAVFLSEQYFLPFWLIGGLASTIWAEDERRRAPKVAAHPEPVESRARPEPDYDEDVRERQVEQRERRVAALFAASRAQQGSLRTEKAELARRERELDETGRQRSDAIDRRAAALAERERELAARLDGIAQRSQEIQARDAEQRIAADLLEQREREVAKRERAVERAVERLKTAEKELRTRTKAVEQGGLRPKLARLPTLGELERLVREASATAPDRARGLDAALTEVRRLADSRGRLPRSAAPRVRELFGDLLERRRRPTD